MGGFGGGGEVKYPDRSELDKARGRLDGTGLRVKLCPCGHSFSDHSLVDLGPCYGLMSGASREKRVKEKVKAYDEKIEFKIGNRKKGECDCSGFFRDEFTEDVLMLRKINELV